MDTPDLNVLRGIDSAGRFRGPEFALPHITDTVVAGVPVRIYGPAEIEGPRPVAIYIHGGGWVHGDLDRCDRLCRDLARRSSVTVLSVDYRKAPEHPYPAGLDDAWSVVREVCTRQAQLAVDPTRVALCGDSAGGNLAAVISGRCRDAGLPIAHQILLYPITDTAMHTESYRSFAEGYGLTAARMAWYVSLYVAGADPRSPDIAPLRLSEKAGLPATTIVTAERDVLRDEGEEYGRQLAAAGVAVEVVRFDDVPHGFVGLPGLFPVADRARRLAADRLIAALLKS